MTRKYNIKCPYCGDSVSLRSSLDVYKKYYTEYLIVCDNYPDCDSYVGVHKKTLQPLGRLANKELRLLKVKAHLYFDSIWIYRKEKQARKKGYKWLSEQLKIDVNDTHIGYFDEETTKKVIKLCKPYYDILKDK